MRWRARAGSADRLALLGAVLLVFLGASVAADQACEYRAVFEHLEKLIPLRVEPNAGFDEIGVKYRKLVRNRPALEAADIDLKRLVNIEDWESSLQKNIKPTKAYGTKPAVSWLQSLRYVNRHFADSKVDANLLKKIHELALQDVKFHGFEGRRIRADYKSGKITQDEFRKRLDQAFKEDKEVSGVSHATLRGKYRSEAIDEIEHRGSSFKPDGTRYFTAKELKAMRENPYMRVDEKSIKQTGPDTFEGSAYYAQVKSVPQAVDEVIARTHAKLANAAGPEDVIRAIVRMERDLVSIHPFLDGNGRSIRLLGDVLRRQHGLPPALYPNESDLIMTETEALEFHRKAMADYVNAWADHIDGKAKP